MEFYIWAKCQKGEGMKALPKDMDHFKRIFIVKFYDNSFFLLLFGKMSRGGMPKILEHVFFCTFDHFILLKVLGERTVFQSLIYFLKPTKKMLRYFVAFCKNVSSHV